MTLAITDSGTPRMQSTRFRAEREATWRELQVLVERVEKKGVASLNPEQLSRLPRLYRTTVSALSVARSISLDRNVREYLESLTQRAYFCVYGPKRRLAEATADFILAEFPRAVRRYRWFIAVAAGFMILGGITGGVLVTQNSEWYYSFVSEEMSQGRDPGATVEELEDVLYEDMDFMDGLSSFAAGLFSHNSAVGILCFSLGFLAGIPVFLLLFYNGILIGAMSAVHHQKGLAFDWWGWILPHGVTELFAIVLCGAAGLIVASSLVFPGRHRRMENLALHGRVAGRLVVGAVLMLLIAGLIEGLFRQLVQDPLVRYGVATLTTVLWFMYFTGAGRESET